MKKSTATRRWDGGEDGQVRVLLECAPEHSPDIIASLIERHGYDVRTCTGPGDRTCNLLEHGACALVDGADVVVNMMGGADDGEVLAAVADVRRPPAIVAELAHGRTPPACTGAAEVTVVRAPMTRRTLLDGIVSSLTHREDPVPPGSDPSA